MYAFANRPRRHLIMENTGTIPTDDASIIADFKIIGVQDYARWLPYERRVRELENEGLTRSDAQGVADAEGL